MIDEKYWRSNDPLASYPDIDRKAGQGFKILTGFSVNPWESFPRNLPCFCKSGLKFKKCHRDKISPVIETSKIKMIKEIIFQLMNGALGCF